MSSSEQQQPELQFAEEFLFEKKSITQFPNSFSFKSRSLIQSISELKQKSEEAGDVETGGVLYIDQSVNPVFHHFATGTKEGIEMFIIDLNGWDIEVIKKYVDH